MWGLNVIMDMKVFEKVENYLSMSPQSHNSLNRPRFVFYSYYNVEPSLSRRQVSSTLCLLRGQNPSSFYFVDWIPGFWFPGCTLLLFYLFSLFRPRFVAFGILVSQPGIESRPEQ